MTYNIHLSLKTLNEPEPVYRLFPNTGIGFTLESKNNVLKTASFDYIAGGFEIQLIKRKTL